MEYQVYGIQHITGKSKDGKAYDYYKLHCLDLTPSFSDKLQGNVVTTINVNSTASILDALHIGDVVLCTFNRSGYLVDIQLR